MVGDLELSELQKFTSTTSLRIDMKIFFESFVGVMATCDDNSQHLLILKFPRLPTISNGRQDETLEGSFKSSWKIGQPKFIA